MRKRRCHMGRPKTHTQTGTITLIRRAEILTTNVKNGFIIGASKEFKKTFPGTPGQLWRELEPFIKDQGWAVIFRPKDDE